MTNDVFKDSQSKTLPISKIDIGQELEMNQGSELDPKIVNESDESLLLDKKKLALVMVAMLLSLLVSTLDNTIVSTSLVQISSEFNSLNQITWVAASYLLTETAVQPLYGKLSDLFGSKIVFTFALVLFLIGSIGSGFSQSLLSLIVFRAISGIGGGGIAPLTFIVISDIVPVEQRSIFIGFPAAIYGISSVIGPLIGGAFTDRVTWRWSFYINIPICVFAILMIQLFLKLSKKKNSIKEGLKRVDYFGSMTLALGSILLVLALNWGGKDYSWGSAPVLVPLFLAFFFYFGFVVIEKKYAIEPIIPGRILNRQVISANLTSFFNGFFFISLVYYLPLYYQVVYGYSATYAGLETLPLLLGEVSVAIISGIIISKTGLYRPISIMGTTISLIAIILLACLMREDITRGEQIFYVLLSGIGLGSGIQTNMIASQSGVSVEDRAVVTSLVSFSFSMGSVLGLAIQGSVFTNVLGAALRDLALNIDPLTITESMQSLSSLSSLDKSGILFSYVKAIRYIFISLIPFTTLSFISSLFLRHIPLY